MKEITVMILKAGDNSFPTVETIKDDLDEFYKIIECNTIDIVSRKIGGIYYDIICDEEALLKDSPVVSVVSKDGSPLICGNIIICNSKEGELKSLSNTDIYNLIKYLGIAKFKDTENKESFYVMQADY